MQEIAPTALPSLPPVLPASGTRIDTTTPSPLTRFANRYAAVREAGFWYLQLQVQVPGSTAFEVLTAVLTPAAAGAAARHLGLLVTDAVAVQLGEAMLPSTAPPCYVDELRGALDGSTAVLEVRQGGGVLAAVRVPPRLLRGVAALLAE